MEGLHARVKGNGNHVEGHGGIFKTLGAKVPSEKVAQRVSCHEVVCPTREPAQPDERSTRADVLSANVAPDPREIGRAFENGVRGDPRRVDCSDRGAQHEVGADRSLREGPDHPDLDGPESAASREDESGAHRDRPDPGSELAPSPSATHRLAQDCDDEHHGAVKGPRGVRVTCRLECQ